MNILRVDFNLVVRKKLHENNFVQLFWILELSRFRLAIISWLDLSLNHIGAIQ